MIWNWGEINNSSNQVYMFPWRQHVASFSGVGYVIQNISSSMPGADDPIKKSGTLRRHTAARVETILEREYSEQ